MNTKPMFPEGSAGGGCRDVTLKGARTPAVPRPESKGPRVELASVADLPTSHGVFRIHVFTDGATGAEHVALVSGEVFGQERVATRIHSECLTGDAFGSLRCDCREQLDRGLARIAARPCGVLLYMRQEGRGIGLANKIRAYRLQQERGLDTVEANLALGLPDDCRDYAFAASMLRELGVRSVALMTNNPDKIAQLGQAGMPVATRIPHVVAPGPLNHAYLETKARRSGHLLYPNRTSAA
jgi:GTP cyclohydrolase II